MLLASKILKKLFLLSLSILSIPLLALPMFGAERIVFSSDPRSPGISVADLEIYARQGRASPELAIYLKLMPPAMQEEIRSALLRPTQLSTTQLNQFLSSAIGISLLQQVGQLLQTESGQNGAKALKTAVINATSQSQGFNVLDVLHHFPGSTIRFDLEIAFSPWAS
jgi:hypothetical protein